MTIGSRNELRAIIKHEVEYLIEHASHPEVHKDIDAVWVFSGPGTFFIPLDTGEPPYFAWMDRYRILYGLAIVRKVTTKRMGKKFEDITREDILTHGPLFIYNGTPDENEALRKELDLIEKSFPTENAIIIDDVNEGGQIKQIANTLDQVESFPKSLLHSKIKNRIALVSHAPHLSRILRYLEKYQTVPKNITIELFPLIDSNKNTKYDIEKEVDKIWEYFKKGDLSWNSFPAENLS